MRSIMTLKSKKRNNNYVDMTPAAYSDQLLQSYEDVIQEEKPARKIRRRKKSKQVESKQELLNPYQRSIISFYDMQR